MNQEYTEEQKGNTYPKENDIPFIRLYHSPKGFYFFDVIRNKVCEIDHSAYLDLERWLIDSKKPDSKAIDLLINDGWLSTERPTKLRHPATDNILSYVNHNLSTLVLQVTQACNLSCIYCPFAINKDNGLSRTHQNKTMSYETAKMSIDYLYDNSDEIEEINISFYGGEPIIAFPLVQRCVEYADALFDGKKVRYSLTTNATLMTEDIIDFFAEHRFNLTFSMDGPPKIHDRHRLRADGSPTYSLVMDTLQRTVTRYKEMDINDKGILMINAVINPEDSFDDILEWLSEEWATEVLVQASIVEDYYLERKFNATSKFNEQLRYQLTLSLLSYLDIVQDLSTNPITDGTVMKNAESYSIIREKTGELADETCPGGPCISGVSKLFVNVDGFFYPCEKVNELSDSMKIGSVERGLDLSQITRHMNIASLSPDKCKNCWAQLHCNTCQRQADGGAELSAKAKNRFCSEVYNNVDAMLRTYILFSEVRTQYRV